MPFLHSIQSVLNHPIILQMRRNHGLEHATLHVLSQRHPGQSFSGYSDPRGFWLMGEVSSEEVSSAVEEALQRLRSGESQLAVHPYCGTNFVASGILASLAASIALFGVGKRWRDRLERLPLAASLAVLALILAQPLGMALQEQITTLGDPGSLQVAQIVPKRRGGVLLHRVFTRG